MIVFKNIHTVFYYAHVVRDDLTRNLFAKWKPILEDSVELQALLKDITGELTWFLRKQPAFINDAIEVLIENIDISDIEAGNLTTSITLSIKDSGILWSLGTGSLMFSEGEITISLT